ncbi:MAG: hypothetical protein NT027_10065 [Proteobacteria bacterium]|nr:hypothetical protein [Pseudomonadota bacterium]
MKIKMGQLFLIICGLTPSFSLIAETYVQLKPVIEENCTRCHNADGIADFLPFESFADVKSAVSKMLTAIQSGRMPKDNPGFNAAPDGKRLMTWLTSGEDLFPAPPVTPPPVTPPPVTPPPSGGDNYASIKPILEDNCTRCHNADGIADFLPFESLADVKSAVTKMTTALESGRMPKDNPGFNSSAAGKRLLTWLKTGKDIHGSGPTPPVTPSHPILKDPRTLTYDDVKVIIRQNCVGCHNPNGQMSRWPLETLPQVQRKRTGMIKQLNKQNMPLGNPEFRFSQDGRALLGWLEFGKEFGISNPPPVGGDDDG